MRWWSWVWAAPVLVLACGCGSENYNKRLEQTIAQMKRDRRLLKNLEPAPSGEKKFTDLALYVRSPKGEARNKVGFLNAPEGQYELNETFGDAAGSAMHLLARVKLPKKPPTKGQPTPAAPVARGDFTRDVLDILNGQFGPVDALATPKFAPEQKGDNRFNRLVATTANEKELKVYTYKKDNTEAALVFVYDPKLRGSLAEKIDDSLATFATGPKASRTYSGADPDDEAASAPSTAL